MGSIKITAAGKSDIGKIRKTNEDSLYVGEDVGLFIVADGMGGHNAGEVASAMAVKIISDNLRSLIESRKSPAINDKRFSLLTNQLAFCARLANQAIFEASRQYVQNEGMGTTMSALCTAPNFYAIAHIGDSRIYRVGPNALEQLTQDHTLVMDQMRRGLISQQEAERSNMTNVLSRAMGIETQSKIDIEQHSWHDQEMFLLCSDGLTKMLDDEEMLAIIRTAKTPAAICDTCVEAANAAGGRDNVSVVVIKIEQTGFLKNIKERLSRPHA